MTAVAQQLGSIGKPRVAQRLRVAATIAARTVLSLALLPLTLLTGVLVALDVGFPLLVHVRRFDGVSHTQSLRFRTTRVNPHATAEHRSMQSGLGRFIERSSLADLPNLYLALFQV